MAGMGAGESTITYDTPVEPRAREPAFPVPGWERYRVLRFLGQGAMGRVFLAHDPRLQREVAIKLVNGDDPEHVRRLVSEARAQARIRHPRVCDVHEVGEVEGRVYIAMRYIAGQPLGALVGELSLEQKVMVLRDAAEGVHEAHRAGIIHRDVKPSNIMVERGEDGALTTFVMDFGLARTQDASATMTGTVLGTPRYMAPEQARGDHRALDRRADVYSLGATLYHLISGAPPIPGDTAVEVIRNLETAEPLPLRAREPGAPADLEAIVGMCLEKDRARRYDSARALADDLTRFLDGDPVRARPVSAWYRLRKAARKHRRIVAIAAAALALSLVAVGWAWRRSGEAATRERLARRFTEQVERIEASARYAALSPRHDVRGDRASLRAQMAALAAEVEGGGSLAVGPGHYALGRGQLALGDDDAARGELERAWRAGFREPRAAYALAIALGRLYHRERLAAARLEPAARRGERLRELAVRYRDPAQRYLAASLGGDASSARYVLALTAFYNDQADAALHVLDGITGLPWFYEAGELRGDILLARGLELRDRGDYAGAGRAFAAGRDAYTAAAAIGESVPSIYASLSQLEAAALLMVLYGAGDTGPPFARAIAASDAALAIAPDDYDVLVVRAGVARSLAEHHGNAGLDADELIAQAIGDAERALQVAPERTPARLELVRAFTQRGVALQGQNRDPGEPLTRALALSDAIPDADRDARYFGNRGQIFKTWADYEDDAGRDARAHRAQAVDAYALACAREPTLTSAWLNLGINRYLLGAQEPGRDGDAELPAALQALASARALDPSHVASYFYEGVIRELVAVRQRDRGADPRPELARAAAAYRAAGERSPRLALIANGLGQVRLDEAGEAWDRGGDPAPALAEAEAEFARAVAWAPDQGHGYGNLADVALRRAELAQLRGEDPAPHVRRALAELALAIARIPAQAAFHAKLGNAHAITAAAALASGGDPTAALARADVALREALARKPGDPDATLALAEVEGLAALHRIATGRAAPDELARVAERFEQAIARAPEALAGAVHFVWFEALWAPHDPAAAARARVLGDRVLAVRESITARLARASAALVAAKRGDASEAASAVRDFETALGLQPALRARWGRALAAARRLANER